MSNEITLDIRGLDFEQTGSENDPASRLLATVIIAGVPHHLEAVAVKDSDLQEAADPEFDVLLGDLHEALGPSGPFMTVAISGRKYAMFLSPHQR